MMFEDISSELAKKLFPSEYHGALRAAFVELVAPALAEIRTKALQDAADHAAWFSVREGREIIPGVVWEDMKEAARVAAHATAQSIAGEILLLDEAPEASGDPKDMTMEELCRHGFEKAVAERDLACVGDFEDLPDDPEA